MAADSIALLVGVATAAITSTTAIVVALIRTRHHLTGDHARSADTLARIDVTTARIDERLDSHLEWHAEHPPTVYDMRDT